ncbi:hypothetical protein BGAL_0446g00110 [Botrytis galanthina]|uniref:Uncharacterized protein n=1 Tax=Botrytis galanthina TaxID=278940 RepID=A0A4V4HTJ9_9HELO|nr:hypothetical protein BGAL_0446g00110 [Botrytis galanthina]
MPVHCYGLYLLLRETCNNIPAVTFFSNGNPTLGYQGKYGPTKSYQLFERHNAFKELRLSATNGGSLCKLFQDALECSQFNPDEHLRRFPEYCDTGIWIEGQKWGSLWRSLWAMVAK